MHILSHFAKEILEQGVPEPEFHAVVLAPGEKADGSHLPGYWDSISPEEMQSVVDQVTFRGE